MTQLKTIKLHDKTFRLSIPHQEIQTAIQQLSIHITQDYADKTPVFLGVLNGSFMFMAELMKHITFPCEVSFVKITSYVGTGSVGEVNELIGISESLRGRHVVVVEDIVDTGESIEHIMRALAKQQPASVAVATLLFKPDAYRKVIEIAYPALSVPNRFIVGFGLDYDQLGRNLTDIYELAE